MSLHASFTSALRGDDLGLLLRPPAHGGAGGESENVGLLGGEPRDGELPRVGAHLHRGPSPRVPAVRAVGDLVAWRGTDGGDRRGEEDSWDLCESPVCGCLAVCFCFCGLL